MRILTLVCSLVSLAVFSQSDTEVFLFDLAYAGEVIELRNQRNVSTGDGYDNQPSFYNDNQLLFASTRNGQTDIASYNLRDRQTNWISNTPGGSEYSPLKIPGLKAVSAIRLDTTGLQRLYRYDFKTGKSKLLLEDLVVGYHVWFNENQLVSSVLADGRLDLVVSNLKDNTNYTYQKNIGRSLHKIPNTQLISYVSKESIPWMIKSLDPVSGATKEIAQLPQGVEDYCWLLNGTLVAGKGTVLYKFNPKKDNNWGVLKRFDTPELWNISRLATNAISSLLAVVSDASPEKIVQKQLLTFNVGDLDAFANCFTDDVIVQNYPAEVLYQGRRALLARYKDFFAKNKNINVEVKNRLIQGNKVIDEEWVTVNGTTRKQLTIFEIANGKIATMTFITQ